MILDLVPTLGASLVCMSLRESHRSVATLAIRRSTPGAFRKTLGGTGYPDITNMGNATSGWPTTRPEDSYNFSQHLYQYQFDASLKTDNVRSLSTALDWQAPMAQNSERFCLHTFPSPRNCKPAFLGISL
jgi:hypothetical protein